MSQTTVAAPKPLSRLQIWLIAMRPRAYPAAIAPVLIGSALAYADGKFNVLAALIALVCAMLLQTASNFINDIYDFRKGADNDERLGAKKVLTTGLLDEQTLIRATILVMVTAFVIGLGLVWIAGWVILAIGLLSMLFAFAYTGGPFPLAYNALGDVTVIAFFGVAATSGTYYAHALEFSQASLMLGMATGFLASNILGVNNLRDIPTDAKAGKRTLAIALGKTGARRLYYAQTVLAFLMPVLVFLLSYKWTVLLALLALPLAIKECMNVAVRNGAELNASLAGTARTLMVFGLLTTIGLVLAKP